MDAVPAAPIRDGKLSTPQPKRSSDNAVLMALSVTVSLLAVVAVACGVANWLEAISFITGAVCVWLTVKESSWNFPVGMANVATFSVVFFQSQLYADAGLQVVYFILGAVGWWMWVFGGTGGVELVVSRSPKWELAVLAVLVVVGTIVMWRVLRGWGGPASFWDALTTALSLASQWLLNRKRLESWLGWIVVDVIYVPLYAAKDLYLTAVLYAVFLAMATLGWRAWHKSWRKGLVDKIGPSGLSW